MRPPQTIIGGWEHHICSACRQRERRHSKYVHGRNSGGETGRNGIRHRYCITSGKPSILNRSRGVFVPVIRYRYCKTSGKPSILNRSRSVLIVPIVRIQADDIHPFLGLIHKVPQRRPRINHPLILHTLYILITISHVPKVP